MIRALQDTPEAVRIQVSAFAGQAAATGSSSWPALLLLCLSFGLRVQNPQEGYSRGRFCVAPGRNQPKAPCNNNMNIYCSD